MNCKRFSSKRKIHFLENGITEERAQRVTLLKSIGDDAYTLLKALCDPNLPATRTYTELIELLNKHFVPPVIIYRERLNFYSAMKNADETVSQWYARVKSLALKCKFNNLNDYIRDRFVMGLVNEEKIFDKLCEEDETLSLESALKKALLQETKLKSRATDVNFVRSKNQSGVGYGNNNNSNHQPNRSRSPCKHCGWKSHQSNSCKFKDAVCRSYNKKGHLAPVCRFKEKKNSEFYST